MDSKSTNFKYSLKVSARARYVRLAIKPYQGLEVVIPKRFPKKQIPRILQQHEEWITTQLQNHQHSLQPVELPGHVSITLTDTDFPVRYEPSSKPALRERQDHLNILHSTDLQAVELLRAWIRDKAKKVLNAKLEDVAGEFGFNYKKCIIRSQKSRWGSRSSSGTISLNDQLLFMPAQTVQYLMIHELCHTHHMNHSRQFWRLVEKYCADYKKHEQVLAQRKEWVPDWFLQNLYSG